MNDIGSAIRRARKNKNLTQTDLANLIHKSLSTIQKYELNKVTPSMDILIQLIDVLDIEPQTFFTSISYDQLFSNPDEAIEDYFEIHDKFNTVSFLLDHPFMIEWLKHIGVDIHIDNSGFVIIASKNGVSHILEYSDLYDLYYKINETFIKELTQYNGFSDDMFNIER